jgi:hypothetical protein
MSPFQNPANAEPTRCRKFQEPPAATSAQGWRFHHIGIPTDAVKAEEHYLASFKVFASGFERSSYGVEWLRFESDSPVPELVRSVPHVAFEVDNIEAAIAGKEVIFPPFSPYAGVRAAMIVENGAPIEMLEFAAPSVVEDSSPQGAATLR